MSFWLFKSEPSTFSITDLQKRPNQTEHWDGVRNYQVRNMLRNQMKIGDQAFFYHSNCTPPGIAGTMEIVKTGYPDFTAWDPESNHFDPKSTPDRPRWFMVDVKFIKQFKQIIPLEELRKHPLLENMIVNRPGNRLSITPVSKTEWDIIHRMANC